MKKNIIFDAVGVLFVYTPQLNQGLVPHTEGVTLLQDCYKHHDLYLCSNMSSTKCALLKERYPDLFKSFKGIVTSQTAGASKPQPEIFQYLLNTYDLKPEESFFIDDQEANCAAARLVGMQGIHANNMNEVRAELERLNIL